MVITVFVLSACSRVYTVTFVDFDERVIHTTEVSRGDNVTPPNNPVRFGYIFEGWDHTLENIRQDTVIAALYRPNAELKAFNDILQRVIDSNQITVLTTVTINGVLSNNYEFLREDDTISSKLFNDRMTTELFVTLENGQRYGYEFMTTEDCWAKVAIGDNHFDIMRYDHSRINMLPTTVELHWFDYTDGTYVLKNEYFYDLADRTFMQGIFRHYEFTFTEDELTIYIEVQQGFSRLGYLIEFSGIDNTVVEIPEFDLCIIN